MTRSKKTKTQSSSRAASSKGSLKKETTEEPRTLGDFGVLWHFLQSEKARWDRLSIPAPLVEGIFAPNTQTIESETKKPPQLPHSSSSEYSSEEELIVTEQKLHKTVQQSSKKKVEGIVTVSKEKGTPRKKKAKKALSEDESKADIAVKMFIDGVRKPRLNEFARVNPPSRYNKGVNYSTKTLRSFGIPEDSDDPIYVFIDNSNILVGFLAHCRRQQYAKASSGQRSKPTLGYDALFTILERGRKVARKVLVASSPLYQPLEQAVQAGYEVSVLQRVKRTSDDPQIDLNDCQTPFEMEKEQCVDELLHLKILESLLDSHAPATLVLASGDGKDGEYFEGGFHKCIIKALERGWKVEIISWKRQLSQNFLKKKFLSKWQDLYHVVYLDLFAAELGC